MKKYILVLTLLMTTLIANIAKAEAVSGTWDNGELGSGTWSVSEDGTLTISGQGKMKDYSRGGENIAPWKNPDYLNVGTNHAPSITSVVINDGITSVGKSAFEDMSSIASVSLPEGLESIKEEAFNCCNRLSQINLPSSLKTLDTYAFYATNISSMDLPENLQQIGARAFGYTNYLSSIVIPQNTTVDLKAFEAEAGTTSVQNVYCSGENASCQALKNSESMSGKVQFYHSDENAYFYNNRWYASPNDIVGDNHIQKRIYTINEANRVAGDKNRVSIKYR